jgi:predicted nucleic acid-binding protein
VILDSNVVIALINAPQSSVSAWVLTNRPERVFVNAIIFAEVSPVFAGCADLELFLKEFAIEVEPLDLTTCHRAGHAFREYRRRGGERSTILPDFLIGAQAAEKRWPLVTRDRKGFASYFPDLEIIDPFEGAR